MRREKAGWRGCWRLVAKGKGERREGGVTRLSSRSSNSHRRGTKNRQREHTPTPHPPHPLLPLFMSKPPPNPLSSLEVLLQANTPHLESLHRLLALPQQQLGLDLHRIEDAIKVEMEAVISQRTAEVEVWRAKEESMRKGTSSSTSTTRPSSFNEFTPFLRPPSPLRVHRMRLNRTSTRRQH